MNEESNKAVIVKNVKFIPNLDATLSATQRTADCKKVIFEGETLRISTSCRALTVKAQIQENMVFVAIKKVGLACRKMG